MKKAKFILSEVLMTAFFVTSCGSDVLNSESSLKETEAFVEVNIGSQVWMGKNLNVVKFRNGDPIPEAKTNEAWQKAGENGEPAYCYYNNTPSKGEFYGKLYNWYAVSDPRGLAPVGWRIPSDKDWTILIDYLGGENTAGRTLKDSSGWHGSGNGTNESGFSFLPGGLRASTGIFENIDKFGYLWSLTEASSSLAWYRLMFYYNEKASRSYFLKTPGFSVRCIKKM